MEFLFGMLAAAILILMAVMIGIALALRGEERIEDPDPHNDQCGWCGADPAEGLASINDLAYCHGDARPSCYEQALWDHAQDVARAHGLPLLADMVGEHGGVVSPLEEVTEDEFDAMRETSIPAEYQYPCLWCGIPLWSDGTVEGSMIRCAGCATVYVLDLVKEADPEIWERVHKRRGYRVDRQGDTIVVTEIMIFKEEQQ